MKRLINLFFDLCLLRAGPQDLPASSQLLMVCAVINAVTGTVVLFDSFGNGADAFFAQVMDMTCMLLLLHLGLSYQQREARFIQAATALFGVGVLLNLVSMPVQLLIGRDPVGSAMGELGVLLYLFLMIWTIVVIAHILRHTLEIRFGPASLISIGYFFFINWLVQLFFTVA